VEQYSLLNKATTNNSSVKIAIYLIAAKGYQSASSIGWRAVSAGASHASCGDYCATTFITCTELHALPDFCLISPWQYGLWVWAGAQHIASTCSWPTSAPHVAIVWRCHGECR
jgi:hypothetical protein